MRGKAGKNITLLCILFQMQVVPEMTGPW